MKIILEQEDGTFYELDALSVDLRQSCEFADVSEIGGRTEYIPNGMRIEASFVGVGDVTYGTKRTMIVCTACGSEWKEDDRYHPGTCANCGWGAGSTKREKVIR